MKCQNTAIGRVDVGCSCAQSIGFGQLLHQLFSSVLHVVTRVVHPGMRSELLYCWPVVALEREQFKDQVLEVVGQDVASDLFEVFFVVAIEDQRVVLILL